MKRVDAINLIQARNTIIKASDLQALQTYKGVVSSISNDSITLITDFGVIKLPLIPNLVVNQNISIGVYDVLNSTEMLKLKISVHGAIGVDDKIYQFLVKRDNINHSLVNINDIIELAQNPSNQVTYQLSANTSFDQLVNINFRLHDAGQDKIFLRDNNIYVDINDRLYRIIEEVPQLKNLLSSAAHNVSVTIIQIFNLKENINHLIEIISKSLSVQSLAEVVSILSQSSVQVPVPSNYLVAYQAVFFPIFNQFKRARLQIRESRGSCKILRLIFELESETGILSIIDCLYVSSSLNVVVRSDYKLSSEFTSNLITSFNRFLSQMQLSGSIMFSIQSTELLKQILTDRNNNFHDQNYTCTV